MKRKLCLLITFFLVLTTLIKAQEPLPDTVWSKTFPKKEIISLKFSPDGQSIMVGCSPGLYQLNTFTGEISKTFSDQVWGDDIDFSPTGDTVVTTAGTGLQFWNFHTGELIKTFSYSEFNYAANETKFTPDGKKIIVLSDAKYDIYIIDVEKEQVIDSLGDYWTTSYLRVSRDGKYFCFGNFENTVGSVKLYDINTLEEIKDLGGHGAQLWDIQFSHDSKMIASCSMDGSVIVRDLETFNIIFQQNSYEATGLIFSTDNKYLIIKKGDFDDWHIDVFNINSKQLLYTYPHPYGNSLVKIDISKTSEKIVTGEYNKVYLLNNKWNQTGINNDKNDGFNYYCNQEILNIQYSEPILNLPIINIYDIEGKFIKNLASEINFLDDKNMNINIGFLPDGFYLCELISSGKRFTFKLMK